MDLIVSPTIVALNTQSGAPKLAQAVGQLIDALVLQVIDATTVRLKVGENVVDVKTEVPLDPGAQVKLAVRGYGDETRWVIAGTGSNAASARSGAQVVSRFEAPVTEVRIAAGGLPAEGDLTEGAQVRNAGLQTAARVQINSPTQPAPPAHVNAAIEFVNATRSAAARQGGLAPVFAELGALVASPDVPTPVRVAATQVLQTSVNLDQPAAANIQQAVTKSGLFLEARLAGDARVTSSTPAQVQVAVAPGDLKAALFTLRQALQSWLVTLPAHSPDAKTETRGDVKGDAKGDGANPLAQLQTNVKTPAPPYRGAPTSGQQPVDERALGLASTPDIARALLDHTDSAIARQVLMQVASLPDSGGASAPHLDGSQAHWNLEIPFVTPQGTAVAQFEIERDGHNGSARDTPSAPWRANFSLDVEPMGPVHAQIALTGKRTAVRIWAERKDTADALRTGLAELAGALRAADLEAGDVIVREGVPPRPVAPKPGRFLDRAS
ncbi:MAG: flagellar hook-length control protein FliK [Xanthobacteraceae bacterium]